MNASRRSTPIALARRPADHRSEPRVREAGLHARHDLLLGERALLEVLLDQLVVGLGDRLHQLLAGRDRPSRAARRATRPPPRSGRSGTGPPSRAGGRRRPANSCSSPIGSSSGATWLPNADTSWSSVPWNDDRSRSSLLTKMARGRPASTASSQATSVWTSTPSTADTTTMTASTARIGRSQVADEVGVAGRVQHVDLHAVPFDGAIESETRDALALFVGIVVGHGVAVLDRAHPGDRTGREEHGLEQRGLARAAVADQQDVADVLRVVGLQHGLLRLGAGPGGF